jgi:hypothetical protein
VSGRALVISVISTLAAVLLAFFGWAIRAALGPEPERPPLRAGEEILLTRPANHSRGLGGSGYLTLTTQRLLFHARKLSFRREPLSMDLGSIRGARPAGYNHLAVTIGDRHEFFVVDDRADLATLIGNVAAAPETERQAVVAAWREEPAP